MGVFEKKIILHQMNEEQFKVRAYGFGELAQLYFPNLSKRSASAQLRNWIKENPFLIEKMETVGFYFGKKLLTPMIVSLLLEEFGNPC
jgi:lipoprotein NlpI